MSNAHKKIPLSTVNVITNVNVCRKNTQRRDRCYATGIEGHKTKFVLMTPVDRCFVGYRCFEPRIRHHCQVIVYYIVCTVNTLFHYE